MAKLILPLLLIAIFIWSLNLHISISDVTKAIKVPEQPITYLKILAHARDVKKIALNASSTPNITSTPSPTPKIEVKQPSGQHILHPNIFVYQTYNNCGPASLSMLLDYYGINASQQEIADQLRPFQQVKGLGDDKSVTLDELAQFAGQKNLLSFKRPNGDINKLKLFIENEIPVLAVTWLEKDGGFGHYWIIKGYDDSTGELIEDDSIFGMGQRIPYNQFLKNWQVFNYQYLLIFPPDKNNLVQAILKDESDFTQSYKNAFFRAVDESNQDLQNPFPIFNQSTSFYYLNQFEKSVLSFEHVEKKIPARMLWYQIEPILSYQKIKNYDKVISLTNSIISGGNIAFSEGYYLRGQSYLGLGEKEQARKEFEKAILYNKNYNPPQQALSTL